MSCGKTGPMKYLEEISPGDIFVFHGDRFVLSGDYRQSNKSIKKMAISIKNGSIQWIADNEMIELLEIFYRDQEGNLLLLKEHHDQKNNQFS
jgi:hypothetical protein